MRNRDILLLIAFLLSIYPVYGEISITQPKTIYNIGDIISLSVSISSGQSAEGFLRMSLACGNNSNEFYVAPLALNANEQKKIDTNITLSKTFLEELRGKCTILIHTPVGYASSQSFEITDRIELSIALNKLGFSAGEKVDLKGTLLKPNAEPFSGHAEISVEGTDISLITPVYGNKFQLNFTFPENMRSGTYLIRSRVYERDKNGDETNQGFEDTSITVSQQPQKIEIMIDTQSIVPGGNISFKILMYDQANDEVQGDMTVTIKDPENEIAMQQLAKTSETLQFHIENNATSGYWKIESSFQELSVRRLFYVENLELADFEIIGDMLHIKNIGNAPYRKAVQIAIGDEVEIKELELEIGGERRFRLVAPDGIYRVSVTDGQKILTLDSVSLTGNAIGILSEKSANVFVRYPLVWIFVIIVFGMFILMMFERFADRKFISYNIPEKANLEMKKQWTSEGMNFAGVKPAEHTLSIHGQKEDAVLIAFKIKNMPELNKEELTNLESIFGEVRDKNGVVYKTGNYLIVILTPSVTKTFKNNSTAVKISKSLEKKLLEYNKKFSRKIQFGIGINYGSIIVEALNDRIKFSSIGNSLSIAKKIADISKEQVLISRDANAHLESDIKTEKTKDGGLDLYIIKKVTERSDHHHFLEKFLERNK